MIGLWKPIVCSLFHVSLASSRHTSRNSTVPCRRSLILRRRLHLARSDSLYLSSSLTRIRWDWRRPYAAITSRRSKHVWRSCTACWPRRLKADGSPSRPALPLLRQCSSSFPIPESTAYMIWQPSGTRTACFSRQSTRLMSFSASRRTLGRSTWSTASIPAFPSSVTRPPAAAPFMRSLASIPTVRANGSNISHPMPSGPRFKSCCLIHGSWTLNVERRGSMALCRIGSATRSDQRWHWIMNLPISKSIRLSATTNPNTNSVSFSSNSPVSVSICLSLYPVFVVSYVFFCAIDAKEMDEANKANDHDEDDDGGEEEHSNKDDLVRFFFMRIVSFCVCVWIGIDRYVRV